MDALRNFELSYTRPAVPSPWNASIDQDSEAATSAVSSILTTLTLATGAASPVSSIGVTLKSATGAASVLSSIGTLLKLATGAAYIAYPSVLTASEFLTAVTTERADSTVLGQAAAETDIINETLDRYESQQDGWLEEDSKAPGNVAVARAKMLYKSTKRNGYPPVRCYVSADGEVGLIWKKGRGYGNVGFWPDGSLVYYVRATDGTEFRDDIVLDSEYLPGELIKALRTF
jgi:hypothetical protein